MSRIRLLTDEELPERQLEAVLATEASGADASVMRATAHLPELFEAYFKFYGPNHDGGCVELQLKELVRLKIARLNDCFT